MKISIPRIVKELSLSEYAPEMDEAVIEVWVNPPRELLARWDAQAAAVAEARTLLDNDPAAAARLLNELGQQQMEIMAELWSQAPDEAGHWTVEEVQALVAGAAETDPRLWSWLVRRTFELISEHREARKKA